MKYNQLGHTNIKVSHICLGTMTWGQQNSEKEAHQQLDYAVEHGVNFIDTAEMYPVPPRAGTYSLTEQYIGTWIKKGKNRKRVVLATKVAGKAPDFTWIRAGKNRLNRKNIKEAVDASLKRLRTDYIDLYQLHWPERNTNYFGQLGFKAEMDADETPIEETMAVLKGLVDKGKILFYGLSNETPWGMMNCIRHAGGMGMQNPVTIQNPYSLVNRTFEVGNAEVAFRENVGLLAYSPLGFGVLTGKYLKGMKPAGSRLELFGGHFNRYSSNLSMSAAADYVKLAQKAGLKPVHMALAFVLSRPYVTSAIIGATSMEQLEENIRSSDVLLSDEIMEKIEEIHQKKPNPAP
jgi:aryl-alcohol dehydrogenase-like predicted oxidoreductase